MAECLGASEQAVIAARMQLEQTISTTADELVRKVREVQAKRKEMDEYLGTIPKFLELNVGGDTEFTISRETFTRIPSRLAEMFSGRRDHLLPKDAEGRFFLDLDPHQMRAIIDWLTELAEVPPGGTPPPHPRDALAPEQRWGIEELMEHLGLVAPDPKGPAPGAASAGGDSGASAAQWAALDAAVAALPAASREVLRAARDLAEKAGQCALEIAKAEEELGAAPHAPDAGGDFVERYCAAFKGEDPIVALNVSGVHMATARPTLAAAGGSTALAAQFGPAGWPAQKAQMLKGRVVLQANPQSFACVLQYLRFKRLGIQGPGPMAQHPPYLPALLDRLGVPAMKPLLVPPGPLAASVVLSREQQVQVLSWLQPGARAELLFRASRDGFEAAAFHARCDNRGPTLVLAVSAGGHRFGGFADKPWTGQERYAWIACKNAFVFRLGGPEGGQPARRSVKPRNPGGIYCQRGFPPLFGGGSHALYIQSGTGSCQCTFGASESYDQLVPGGGHLLAEADKVTVTEYEVYRIIS